MPRAHARSRRSGPPTSGTSTARSALAEEAWDHFGGIDALVNNAAIGKRKLVQTLTPEDLEITMRINF